jgi:biopolymer transport protein ExbB/TolQ
MNLKEIVSDVSAETSHLMSNISSTLLNVYQTSLNAENLQDEISTFSRIQQEKYNSFAKRVDFLSDTAGALGLLGTVWGMFMVFSSGSLDKDTILAGMGVALLTTLLGLVVSITLNFFSTLIQGYFSGHLENVVQKADELRFRLLEISQDANGKS